MVQTITFSEFSIGTTNPSFVFANNTVSTTGVIVRDGAQPASPVIAANSSYNGPVFIYFENAVTAVSLDAGYFDNLRSTRLEFRNSAGQLLHSVHNTETGVRTFSFSHEDGIASIAVIDEAFDASGFSVDTIVFGDAVADLAAPLVNVHQQATPVDRDFGVVDGGARLIYKNSVGSADQADFIKLNVSAATTARVRVYLNDNPDDFRDIVVDLSSGDNIIRFDADENYGPLEDYTAIVQVVDFVDPHKKFINETLLEIVGGVLNYKEIQSDIFAHIAEHVDNAADAAKLLRKMADAFGHIGTLLSISNRVDNVKAAGDPGRQVAIEVADAFVGFVLTTGVMAGATFVGTPVAGAIGGVVSGLVYEYVLSDIVRTETAERYDEHNFGISDAQWLDAVSNSVSDQMPDLTHLIFDEDWYLSTYQEAAEAIQNGSAVSGIAYYMTTGIHQGHQINAGGHVADVNDLAGDIKIKDPGFLRDNKLGERALESRAGDKISQSEFDFFQFLNEDIRTQGAELNLNKALSALANRIALDWVLNNQTDFELANLEGGENWSELLSSGENYRDFLAALASTVSVDLSATSILLSAGGGETPEDVYANFVSTIEASQLLVGLSSQSVGIAQVGELWVVLISTQNLENNGEVNDQSLLHLAGDQYANDILGAVGRDYISGREGDDHIFGLGGDDLLFGDEGDDEITGGAGADTLRGGDGHDLLIGDGVSLSEVEIFPDIVVGGNGVQVVDQMVDNQLENPLALQTNWSLSNDPNIENANANPHLTLNITASGERYEAFSFWVRAGQTFVFDIDGAERDGSAIDTYLQLFDQDGNQLDYSDDASTALGGAGSTSARDPYLTYTFEMDGFYSIGLRQYSGTFVEGTSITLNISVDELHQTYVPDYGDVLFADAGDDKLIGGYGNDFLDGGAGRDVALFNSNSSEYAVFTRAGDTFVLGRDDEGLDRLRNIEALQFADQVVAVQDVRAFDGLDYLASNLDLLNAIGLDVDAAYDHFINYGFEEGREIDFDSMQYLASNADLIAVYGTDGDAAARHYIQSGRAEGRATNLFDARLYIGAHEEVSQNVGQNLFEATLYYLETGLSQGHSYNDFSALEYIASYGDLISAIGADAIAGRQHFLTSGFAEGRSTSFNGLEYIASYGDLITAFGSNAEQGALHYLNEGYGEGRSVVFDGLRYIASHDDLVSALGANDDAGSMHYISDGYREGRAVDLFDARLYIGAHSDVDRVFGNDLDGATRYYLEAGFAEGHRISDFSGLEYIASFGDLIAGIGNNAAGGVEHFLTYGFSEGRRVTFDGLEYIASYADLVSLYGVNAELGAAHYVSYGAGEGRTVTFDGLRYIASHEDLIQAYGTNEDAGSMHYIQLGLAEGRESSLFDGRLYIGAHADVSREFGTDVEAATLHYLQTGYSKGYRDTDFSGLEYIASSQDLIAVFGVNEQAGRDHFLNYGFSEGRSISFDALGYLASNGDLITTFGSDVTAAAGHYILSGVSEGRSVTFDGLSYIASHMDLIAAYGTDEEAGTMHYVQSGYGENRSVTFDAQAYLDANADLHDRLDGDLVAATVHYIEEMQASMGA